VSKSCIVIEQAFFRAPGLGKWGYARMVGLEESLGKNIEFGQLAFEARDVV
jgi:hypothetical protein